MITSIPTTTLTLASNSIMTKFFETSTALPSQVCLSSLSSELRSNQDIPSSLRSLPFAMLDEIQHQQQQHFEELKHQQQKMEANLSGMPSHVIPSVHQHQQDALLLETFKKQNLILWERIKQYEDTIKNLEKTQTKLALVNARLKVNIHDQIEINNNLVQRNTDIVLDTSAKDQQISFLKEQRKCLTKQNAKLKLFLRRTDSCLDTLKSQQYVLQLQQEEMQRNADKSDSKKRNRNPQDDNDDNNTEDANGESTCGTKRHCTSDVHNDCDVISISSTMDDDDTDTNRETSIVPNL